MGPTSKILGSELASLPWAKARRKVLDRHTELKLNLKWKYTIKIYLGLKVV